MSNRARDRHVACGLGVAFLALLVSVGCATRGGPLVPLDSLRADETMPLFWRIDGDRGATLHLLGSVHVGPPTGWQYPPAVEQAFDRASALFVEVDPADIAGDPMKMLVARYGMLPPGTRLRDRVSDETWSLLEQRVEAADLPIEAVDRMQPWLVANLLVSEATRRLGLSPRGGVDVGFAMRADGRSIVPLESAEYQLSLLASMPAAMQEFMLRDTLDRFDSVEDYVSELVDTWRSGDEKALTALFFGSREPAGDPTVDAFFEVFIDRRSREMAERLRVLLDAEQHGGESVFVVVGVGHLLGEEGIPALLAAQGYAVTRFDRDALLHPMPLGN